MNSNSYNEHPQKSADEYTAKTRPFVLFFIALLVFLLVGSILIPILGLYFGLMLTQITAILGTALVYRKFRSKNQTPDTPNTAPTWPTIRRTHTTAAQLTLILATTVILGIFANLTGALLIELIPALKPMAEESQQMLRDMLFNATIFEQILGAIAITIVAPICEETLFRGTILPEQRPHLPLKRRAAIAILINGILFSAMHVDPVSFVPLTIVGAFFAFITVRTNSLLPAIFAHAVLNAVNGVILPRLTNLDPTAEQAVEQATSLPQLLAITLPTALVLTALWIWLSKLLTSQTAPQKP